MSWPSSPAIVFHVVPAAVSATRMSSRACQQKIDVGADALFFAVAGLAQVDDLLEVAPSALEFQELLAAQRDILRRQLGVGGARQAASPPDAPRTQPELRNAGARALPLNQAKTANPEATRVSCTPRYVCAWPGRPARW